MLDTDKTSLTTEIRLLRTRSLPTNHFTHLAKGATPCHKTRKTLLWRDGKDQGNGSCSMPLRPSLWWIISFFRLSLKRLPPQTDACGGLFFIAVSNGKKGQLFWNAMHFWSVTPKIHIQHIHLHNIVIRQANVPSPYILTLLLPTLSYIEPENCTGKCNFHPLGRRHPVFTGWQGITTCVERITSWVICSMRRLFAITLLSLVKSECCAKTAQYSGRTI